MDRENKWTTSRNGDHRQWKNTRERMVKETMTKRADEEKSGRTELYLQAILPSFYSEDKRKVYAWHSSSYTILYQSYHSLHAPIFHISDTEAWPHLRTVCTLGHKAGNRALCCAVDSSCRRHWSCDASVMLGRRPGCWTHSLHSDDSPENQHQLEH